MPKPKIIRACTVPQSLTFVQAMLPALTERYEVLLVSSPGEGWAELGAEGRLARSIKVKMERRMSPLKDLAALWRLYRVFRRERPAMVHSMTPKAGLLCMLAARVARVPVRVHTFTGLVFPTAKGLTKRILMTTDRLTCACATHIIPEGEGVRRDLLSHHITRKDICVLGHGNCQGIDLQKFDRTDEVMAEAAKIRKPGVFTFLAVGRVVGDKGINELVAAFRKLNSDHPASRLILVGPYEEELDPLLPETIAEIEHNPAIETVGNQSDVRPWYAASDCHVLASYREGFPNVCIEAGAMGLPQIVTDINGANEIIVESENGTIIPSKDAEGLHRAMARMIIDDDWRRQHSANARTMISSRYDHRFVLQCLLDFYDEIMPNQLCTSDISND